MSKIKSNLLVRDLIQGSIVPKVHKSIRAAKCAQYLSTADSNRTSWNGTEGHRTRVQVGNGHGTVENDMERHGIQSTMEANHTIRKQHDNVLIQCALDYEDPMTTQVETEVQIQRCTSPNLIEAHPSMRRYNHTRGRVSPSMTLTVVPACLTSFLCKPPTALFTHCYDPCVWTITFFLTHTFLYSYVTRLSDLLWLTPGIPVLGFRLNVVPFWLVVTQS
jgi:hypothetical protein